MLQFSTYESTVTYQQVDSHVLNRSKLVNWNDVEENLTCIKIFQVCEYFGIEATLLDISMRQYKLSLPTEIKQDRLFTGEIGRLHSMKVQ